MKYIKLFLVTVSFFSVLKLSSQTIKPIESMVSDNILVDNVYYKDTNNRLLNCVGTWEYTSGQDYFKVAFYFIVKEKENPYSNYQRFSDRLYAEYIYIKDGVIKYDNYNNTIYTLPAVVNTKPSELKSNFVKNGEIFFSYSEPSNNDCHRRRVGRLVISLVNNSPSQMQWTRTTDEHYFLSDPCENGVEPDNSDFIIPANMILTRVD